MRSIVTGLILCAFFSPVLLTAQSASGAERVITAPPPADEVTSVQGPVAYEANFVQDFRPTGAPIALNIGLGTLLHLPTPASTVFVANDEIADVQIKDPAFIYLLAKKSGSTVVYASDKSGRVLLSKVVEVQGPVAIIHGSKLDTGEPPPPPNFLVLPLGGAAAPAPAPAVSH